MLLKATLIYRRTGNLRAVQLLLGHTKIESTARYLGIDVDDAFAIAEQVDAGQSRSALSLSDIRCPLFRSLMGQGGHAVLHCTCPLVTQSGHGPLPVRWVKPVRCPVVASLSGRPNEPKKASYCGRDGRSRRDQPRTTRPAGAPQTSGSPAVVAFGFACVFALACWAMQLLTKLRRFNKENAKRRVAVPNIFMSVCSE